MAKRQEAPPDRFVPTNPEAEQAALGSALIDPDAIGKLIEIKLKPEHFYQEKHAWIYTCMLDLHGQGTALDFVTVCDALERRKQLAEIGGAAYVMDLINAVPTSIHVEHYGLIVWKTGMLRGLIRATGEIAQLAYDETAEIETVFATAQMIMFGATSAAAGSRVTSTAQAMMGVVDGIEQAQRHGSGGVPSGFKTLDTYLGGGFQKGNLIIVGGQASMGKTAFALAVALNAARYFVRKGMPDSVAIFSMEMTIEELSHRLISAAAYKVDRPDTWIEYQSLRSGRFDSEKAWEHIIDASGEIASLPIYVDDSPQTLPTLRSGIMRMVGERNAGLVIIDYLQLVENSLPSETREREVGQISRALKGLAQGLRVPIIALSQLSRKVNERKGGRPILSDLRESGGLEQDANVVLFPFRPSVYDDTRAEDAMTVIVAKQRNGPIGDAEMAAKLRYNFFGNLMYNTVTREELNPT